MVDDEQTLVEDVANVWMSVSLLYYHINKTTDKNSNALEIMKSSRTIMEVFYQLCKTMNLLMI